jgi:hypothetical protein
MFRLSTSDTDIDKNKTNCNVCSKCNKIFATKYTLNTHIRTNVCARDESAPTTCLSSRCNYQTTNKYDLQKHIKTCKYIEIDLEIEKIQQQHQTEIYNLANNYQREIGKLNSELAMLRKDHTNDILRTKNECMDSEHERLTSLLEKAIATPTILTNNTSNTMNTLTNTSTNIKGNNNNLQNILAPHELYEKQVDAERIQSIDPSIIEKHFWFGQKGMAKFCVEHIAKVKDNQGNEKMLLCCTDPSRKRFKYYDESNQIVEDMDARHFIGQVSTPIKTVCRDVYDSIMKKIEAERENTTDNDAFFLANKTTIAQQKLFEINNISDNNRNSEYKQEMTILLNK